ncbi:uncharacterized protein HD556DRAFT_1311445 [Suillus plorans]|uniref:Uncharacterized protein n=1 Tax=Suillus plorans TaxID=116603 RepID=A0A9P7AH03_9AGAM|nr:uncharacterized protein HD556DRAFT_1311445 [Suillus plorans]KAG1789265.1 hypothetical protein HD556DRAFT_1311445 [Suillus plorans]
MWPTAAVKDQGSSTTPITSIAILPNYNLEKALDTIEHTNPNLPLVPDTPISCVELIGSLFPSFPHWSDVILLIAPDSDTQCPICNGTKFACGLASFNCISTQTLLFIEDEMITEAITSLKATLTGKMDENMSFLVAISATNTLFVDWMTGIAMDTKAAAQNANMMVQEAKKAAEENKDEVRSQIHELKVQIQEVNDQINAGKSILGRIKDILQVHRVHEDDWFGVRVLWQHQVLPMHEQWLTSFQISGTIT